VSGDNSDNEPSTDDHDSEGIWSPWWRDKYEPSTKELRTRKRGAAQLRAKRSSAPRPLYHEAVETLDHRLSQLREGKVQLEDLLTELYLLLDVCEERARIKVTSATVNKVDKAAETVKIIKTLLASYIHGEMNYSEVTRHLSKGDSEQEEIAHEHETHNKDGDTAHRALPTSRYQAQDQAIETALLELGYDPQNLPSYRTPGRSGLKSQVKNKVMSPEIFTEASFDHAWKRARQRGKAN